MNFSVSAPKLIRFANTPKLLGRVRLVLNIVLLAVLMLILARWVWLLLPPPPESLSASPRSAPDVHEQVAPSVLASIATARFWGTPPVAVPVASVTQDTRLPLSLRGLLSGEGLALIETSGSGTKVYRVGDTLPGGAVLKDVLADHVLIERAGVIERLALPRQVLADSALSSSAGTPSAPSTPASANLGKMLQQSPAELSKEFRLTPVTESGKLRGYRLRALRNPTMLQRAGLEADDVLISVNGTSLTQANDLPKFIKDLRSATSIDAVVLRNGSEIPLHLDLNATP